MEVPRLGGLIGATAAGLCHSHSSARSWTVSVTCTTAHGKAGSSTHWVRPGVQPATSWFLVGFVSAAPQWELRILKFLILKTLVWILWRTNAVEDRCKWQKGHGNGSWDAVVAFTMRGKVELARILTFQTYPHFMLNASIYPQKLFLKVDLHKSHRCNKTYIHSNEKWRMIEIKKVMSRIIPDNDWSQV